MIPVTKPFLPPKQEYDRLLEGIWQRNWLTNNGPLVNELELKLKDYLGVNHLLFVGNGTIALQIAIRALGLTGEIITTPFSFVATASSVVWENCVPVFVDINPKTLNIDPANIEKAITPSTSAILGTHVYGNPCQVKEIQTIADKHKLRVIYDGAHAFGVKLDGKSLFDYGDISTASFHATKLYHTIEGGAVVTKDPELVKTMAYMRNFGHDGPDRFSMVGINGKNSEFHAAMGLVNLPYADTIIARRKELADHYNDRLKNFKGVRQLWHPQATNNYAYYPLQLEDEALLLKVMEILNQHEIFPRRYFYPLLDKLPYVKHADLPHAERAARQALCLPFYYDISKEEIDLICRLMLRVQNN